MFETKLVGPQGYKWPPEPLTEDPLLLEFVGFADRKGWACGVRRWVTADATHAAGRVADAVLASSCKRNAYRGLLKDLRREERVRAGRA